MAGTGTMPATSEKDIGRVVQSVRELYEGRSQAIGTVTLTAGQTTTVVNHQNCAPSSYPQLEPMTANAAAARATTYISAVAKGSFTITHANNAQTDRTFSYALRG